MRTFIIGDVHGCYDELRSLFFALNPEKDDQFVFLGDLGDKGQHSLRVYRYVRLLLELYPGSAAVGGNHESKALERLRQGKLHKGEQWTRDASEADWDFIKSMPLYHRVPGLNVIAVHGGFFPRFFDLYPDGLDDDRLLGKENWQHKGNRYVKRARRFQYIRYINPETGDMLPLNMETEDTPHWGSLYDGREGFAFYGHQPNYSGNVEKWENAMGLDTAAVAGMFLTAAVLTHREGGKYDISIEQVSATESTIENARRHQAERDREKAKDEATL